MSSCHHNERPLHKVAPKGRPVSQCPHCRSLRKARAQHVRCECVEKVHSEADCPHKKLEQRPEPSTCCCSHGSRCTCSLKKDLHKEHHLESVPEDAMCDMATPESFDIRPRSSISTPSESKMTVFANGHHKPVHKHNDAAHTRGLPYTIPRSHTIHGHSELAQRSVDSLPHTKRSLLSHEPVTSQDSITSVPQPTRQVKSEHGSPELTGTDAKLAPINTALPCLDSNYSPYGILSGANSPITCGGLPLHLPDQLSDSYFGYPPSNPDFDAPLHSAGINPPSVDWSSFNIPYDPNGDYSTAPSQPPSYASFDLSHLSHPGLTSSSGEISEAEEYSTISEPPGNLPIEVKFDAVDIDQSRLSSASSMMAMPQHMHAMNMLKEDNTSGLDIDEFIRRANERTEQIEAENRRKHASSISSSRPSTTSPPKQSPQNTPFIGLTVQEAQSYAHMTDSRDSSDSASEQRNQPIRQLSNGDDPMWSSPEIHSPEDIKWSN